MLTTQTVGSESAFSKSCPITGAARPPGASSGIPRRHPGMYPAAIRQKQAWPIAYRIKDLLIKDLCNSLFSCLTPIAAFPPLNYGVVTWVCSEVETVCVATLMFAPARDLSAPWVRLAAKRKVFTVPCGLNACWLTVTVYPSPS